MNISFRRNKSIGRLPPASQADRKSSQKPFDRSKGNVYIYPTGYMMDEMRIKVLNRLKRIEGQIRGLERMVEQEAP